MYCVTLGQGSRALTLTFSVEPSDSLSYRRINYNKIRYSIFKTHSKIINISEQVYNYLTLSAYNIAHETHALRCT